MKHDLSSQRRHTEGREDSTNYHFHSTALRKMTIAHVTQEVLSLLMVHFFDTRKLFLTATCNRKQERQNREKDTEHINTYDR